MDRYFGTGLPPVEETTEIEVTRGLPLSTEPRPSITGIDLTGEGPALRRAQLSGLTPLL